jgi:hypothetical protein
MATRIPAEYLGTTTSGIVHAEWDEARFELRVTETQP